MISKLPSIPEAVSDLSTLRFLAQHAVEGTLSGVHRSGLFGSSIEFAEHKPYAAGDDLKHIDWKVYGRADKYYLKRFEDETNLRAYVVLDTSNSMKFGTAGHSKLNYAVVLAATLAYLFIQQQDLVGLIHFGADEPNYIPPRGRMPHFQVLSETLQQVQPGGKEKLPGALAYLRERIHRRAVVLVLSDFIFPDKEIAPLAKMFRGQDYDLFWFQIIDPAEADFSFQDWSRFEGMEGEDPLETNASEVAKRYRKEFSQWIAHVHEIAVEHDTFHRLVRTDESIRHVLASVLS